MSLGSWLARIKSVGARGLGWRGRMTRLAVVALVAFLLLRVLPEQATEQTVVLDFSQLSRSGRADGVTGLHVAITPVGEDDASQVIDLNLSSPLPDRISRTIRVPDGEYRVSVTIRHKNVSRPATSRDYRVTLRGGEVALYLRED
jgi:hypothetical protein